MKILHIGNLKSGIDTYVRNTVALAGDELNFVIVGGADDNSKPYLRKGIPVKNYSICLYRALNPIKDVKAIIQAIGVVRKEKPDAIHCHSAKGGMVGRIVGFLTGVKTFYTPHAFSFLSAESSKKRMVFLWLEKLTKFKTNILACSETERDLAIKEVHYKPNRCYAWNNAIPKIEDADIVEPKGLDKDEQFIISIGRPSYQKNPLLMVEIMKRVHQQHKDIKFYLLGVGFYSPMLEEMKALIEKYNLEEVIKLLPWADHKETLGYLKRSVMYLTTSLYEGLPIAVLEAMAMGKAIVASDVMGNRDCVKQGYNGYLLPMDADVFAEHICKLLDNDTALHDLGKHSVEYFQTDFYINNRIKDLEKIYLDR